MTALSATLENDPNWQALHVDILSIALDARSEQAAVRDQYGIQAPMLIDTNAEVSTLYDVMQWVSATGEPGHTFVLIDGSGHLAWLRDYGAASHGGSMYVPTDELVAAVAQSLAASHGH